MTTEGKGPIVIPCYLVDGVPYVLEIDAAGKLAVRAAELETLLGAGLPAALDSLALKVKEQSPISGFATSAKQDTMITALQLIDDLRAALGSVNTDDLQVDVKTMPTVTVQAAGGDKIFSIEAVIGKHSVDSNLPAGAAYLNSDDVPAGKLWVITNIVLMYYGAAPTRIILEAYAEGDWQYVKQFSPIVSYAYYDWQGHIYLTAGLSIRIYINDATLGDDAHLFILGYQMDAP